MNKKIIGIIGAGNAEEPLLKIAEDIGKLIARRNAILVYGGLGEVMEAAAKGASPHFSRRVICDIKRFQNT